MVGNLFFLLTTIVRPGELLLKTEIYTSNCIHVRLKSFRNSLNLLRMSENIKKTGIKRERSSTEQRTGGRKSKRIEETTSEGKSQRRRMEERKMEGKKTEGGKTEERKTEEKKTEESEEIGMRGISTEEIEERETVEGEEGLAFLVSRKESVLSG